ncbi:MBL fold metallo-hydrolase [Gryllotalpicola ginsengisoli]|uniref:MBL fold metallo-hydrolase n=1 Tax=Gryllotalpicola ginsengisoli TaxID=444608 RepID=UPI0003B3FCDB|nr:MBL fold metallo-hydrolase [Gryllotalpicola ginsengisoli]
MTTEVILDPAERAAATSDAIPEPVRVADGVWTMPVEFPSEGQPLRYTLGYVLLDGDGGVHLIDPGVDTDANWQRLEGLLAALGTSVSAIRTVIATHLHFDHLGMAERVQRATGAAVVLHRLEQAAIDGEFGGADPERFDRWGVPRARRDELARITEERFTKAAIAADRLVDGGDVLELGDRMLEVIWTPGHTYGSMCLRDAERKLLFTGDHVLPLMNPGLGLGGPAPSNPISDYLVSLDKVIGFDDHQVCPGHGYRFLGLRARCERLAAHHARRTAEVAAVLDRLDRPSVWQVASQLYWSMGWENLSHYLLDSALAQTELHIARLGRHHELEKTA